MTKSKKSKNAISKITDTEVKIGAHLSIAGGYENALIKAKEIGCNTLQIFSSSPRVWIKSAISTDQSEKFKKLKKELGIDPIYFHASYLVNLADNARVGELSINCLIEELNLANKLDIKGTIVHLGSFKGQKENYELLLKNINRVLENTPPDSLFIIENAGNKKICCKFNELWYIVSRLKNDRVKICLDTCHLWASGTDISSESKFDKYFSLFEKKIGIDRLEVIQVNDSKDLLGSFRDRHENLGKGNIPLDEFRLLLTDQRTKNIPMILEVPGFDKKGPDKKNVEILRNYF